MEAATARSSCPYCGQPLVHEEAISHLHRRELEIEAQRRKVERELRTKAIADARRTTRVELERKVKSAVEAETKKRERLLERLDKTKEELADLRSERQGLLREQKIEIATLRRESEAAHKRELREALKNQRATDREKIAAAERAKAERGVSRRQRALEQSVKTLEADKDQLERQLDRLRAADQGELNEEELFERLRAAFRDDDLTRTRRGRRGSDIFHRVRYRDGRGDWDEAGLIIYECKDTLRWNNEFIAQAKRAGKTHAASYTVLVSRAFPRGQKHLLTRDGVVVVHPTLLLHVAHVVRRMVAEVHRTGLGSGGRARKTEELYAYLKSEKFKHSLESIVGATSKLKGMLETERDSHLRTWSRRENAYNEIRETTATIDEDIRTIVERSSQARKGKVVPIKGAS